MLQTRVILAIIVKIWAILTQKVPKIMILSPAIPTSDPGIESWRNKGRDPGIDAINWAAFCIVNTKKHLILFPSNVDSPAWLVLSSCGPPVLIHKYCNISFWVRERLFFYDLLPPPLFSNLPFSLRKMDLKFKCGMSLPGVPLCLHDVPQFEFWLSFFLLIGRVQNSTRAEERSLLSTRFTYQFRPSTTNGTRTDVGSITCIQQSTISSTLPNFNWWQTVLFIPSQGGFQCRMQTQASSAWWWWQALEDYGKGNSAGSSTTFSVCFPFQSQDPKFYSRDSKSRFQSNFSQKLLTFSR
jgi:hypothetical protein